MCTAQHVVCLLERSVDWKLAIFRRKLFLSSKIQKALQKSLTGQKIEPRHKKEWGSRRDVNNI